MAKLFQGKIALPDNAFTHAAKFHADDVFSTAFLQMIKPDIQVRRGLEVPEDFDGIVYDIGRGKFDHHQEEKEYRENGCPYAAFGLLWREFGTILVGEEEAKQFDENFIQPLDETDNTGCHNVLSEIIEEFNPTWDSEESYDQAFWQAVAFCRQILENHFEKVEGIWRARDFVLQEMERGDGQVLVLSRYVPWKSYVIGSGYKYVVYPSNRGGYSAQGVPADGKGNALLCDFPAEWCGKEAEELVGITGLATVRFCHPGGFLLSAQTQEDAVAAARMAIKNSEI